MINHALFPVFNGDGADYLMLHRQCLCFNKNEIICQ